MGRQELAQGFNKEKLVFLIAGLVLGGAVYTFVVTSPLLLEESAPVSTESPPGPAEDVKAPPPELEDYYVVDGKITGYTNKQPPNGLVNRKRKTPFTPAEDYLMARALAAAAKAVVTLPPPPSHPDLAPPPPPDSEKKTKDPKQRFWDEHDATSLVEYKGVVTMGGETYGQLKPLDGSKWYNVKVGDMIQGLDYTVKLIEKQAITVADADGHTFLLWDKRYLEEGLEAEGGSGKDEAAARDEGGKGGKGKDKGKGGKGKGGKSGAAGKDSAATAAGAPTPTPAGLGNKLADIMDKFKAGMKGPPRGGPPQQ